MKNDSRLRIFCEVVAGCTIGWLLLWVYLRQRPMPVPELAWRHQCPQCGFATAPRRGQFCKPCDRKAIAVSLLVVAVFLAELTALAVLLNMLGEP